MVTNCQSFAKNRVQKWQLFVIYCFKKVYFKTVDKMWVIIDPLHSVKILTDPDQNPKGRRDPITIEGHFGGGIGHIKNLGGRIEKGRRMITEIREFAHPPKNP